MKTTLVNADTDEDMKGANVSRDLEDMSLNHAGTTGIVFAYCEAWEDGELWRHINSDKVYFDSRDGCYYSRTVRNGLVRVYRVYVQ